MKLTPPLPIASY